MSFNGRASCQSIYGFQTDIWSLAVMVYELATLEKPFDAFFLPQLIFNVTHGEVCMHVNNFLHYVVDAYIYNVTHGEVCILVNYFLHYVSTNIHMMRYVCTSIIFYIMSQSIYTWWGMYVRQLFSYLCRKIINKCSSDDTCIKHYVNQLLT